METYIYVSVPDTFLYKVIKHDNIKESASEICESMKRTVVELREEKCLGIIGSTKFGDSQCWISLAEFIDMKHYPTVLYLSTLDIFEDLFDKMLQLP